MNKLKEMGFRFMVLDLYSVCGVAFGRIAALELDDARSSRT